MDPHLFSEIAVLRFNNHLRDHLHGFIQDNAPIRSLYQQAEARYSKRVINNVLDDFLVKGLQENRPIFFTDDSEYELAEKCLEETANEFISRLPDLVFLSVENDPELMDYIIQHPDELRDIQQNVRETLIELYHVIPTGVIEERPVSNLLNRYRRMMLKAEEEM